MPGLLALAAAAGVVTLAGWLSRRPGRRPLPREDYLAAWVPLHSGIPATGLVGAWLRAVHPPAGALARAGVRPAVLTAAAVVAAYGSWAVAAAGGRWVLAAAALVAVSGILDGLDGAVAVVGRRASRSGGLADSAADRAAEACFALALWQVGGLPGLVVAAAATGAALEYLRARAAAVGIGPLAVVTVGERPTRLVLVGIALLVGGALPARAGSAATAGAAALTAVSAAAVLQLALAARRAEALRPGR